MSIIYLGKATPASGQGGGSGEAVWGEITGTLENQTDLATALAGKQDTLTAGTGISISDNVISATGGATSVENKNTAVGATNPLNFWEGTEAEYNSGGGSQTWYNWQSSGGLNFTYDLNTSGCTDIAFGNNKFVCIYGSNVTYSTDGQNWSSATMPSSLSSFDLLDITFGNNLFMAIGSYYNNGTTLPLIVYSSDGQTWTKGPDVYFSYDDSHLVCGNGKFIILGINTCLYSSDGTSFTEGTIPLGSYYDAVYGNNKFVAVGDRGSVYSTDGQTWTSGSGLTGTYNGVAYGNGLFVAVGNNHTAYSTDGQTWIETTIQYNLTFIEFGNNVFVAVGTDYVNCMYSTDGQTWIQGTPNTSYISLSYGNNKFVGSGWGLDDDTYMMIASANIASSSVFTTSSTPTISDIVYSAPNTVSALTITSIGTGTITLSDTNTYDYNVSGNQTTTQTVGEAHPDWICMIEGVGIKKGNTTIA